MSDAITAGDKPRVRRMVVRAAIAAVYLALGLWVFIGGRGHTLLLDNKSAEDGSYAAFNQVDVSVNGKEAIPLARRERDKALVVGQKHTIRFDANGKTYEASFRVPFGEDLILVSIPKLAAGIEPFWEPFRTETVPRPQAEEEAVPSIENPSTLGG